MSRTLCIVGTDTDVGKTFIAGLLLHYLQEKARRPGYVKLVSCGGEMPPDCWDCQQSSGLSDEQVQALYHFDLAASPHLAAEHQGTEVEVDALIQGVTQAEASCDSLVLEGVGGLLVPLRRDLLLGDFLASQQLPLIVVARSGLGTLNHTLLTIEVAKQRHISIIGIIFSDEQLYDDNDLLVQDNMHTIAQLTGVTVLGRMRRCQTTAEARECFMPVGAEVLERIL